jgi:hypothetical protein
MEETRTTHKIVIGKLNWKTSLANLTPRSQSNIKVDFRKNGVVEMLCFD